MNLKIPIFFLNVNIFFTEAKIKKRKISKNWRRKKRIIKFKIEHPPFFLNITLLYGEEKRECFLFSILVFVLEKENQQLQNL